MADQKKALVTGASEGIGRAFSRRLATAGYTVTAIARNESRLESLIQELAVPDHTFQAADLSTHEGMGAITKELERNHYDLCVNNAGFGMYGRFYEADLARLQSMTRLNCDALVAVSHAFLRNARSGDALVNVSSALAFMPMPSAGL